MPKLSRKTIIVVSIVSMVLFIYCLLFLFNGPLALISAIFFSLPFLLIWTVITILKDKSYEGRELGPDEEYGYEDKPTAELGTF